MLSACMLFKMQWYKAILANHLRLPSSCLLDFLAGWQLEAFWEAVHLPAQSRLEQISLHLLKPAVWPCGNNNALLFVLDTGEYVRQPLA